MTRTQLPDAPWEHLASDFMGPLPPGKYMFLDSRLLLQIQDCGNYKIRFIRKNCTVFEENLMFIWTTVVYNF